MKQLRVLVVAPSPPPYGGMALQATQLVRRLREDGLPTVFFASNQAFPRGLRFLNGLPGGRTLVRFAILWVRLLCAMRQADVIHVLAASWAYFFLVVYPAAVVAWMFGKHLVLNYRGGEAGKFFARYGWLARPVFWMSNAVTVPSEFLAGVIRARFGVAVSIVPNILDTRAFVYRPRKAIQPRMLSARHLEKIYDVESVLRAFQAVQANYPEASLWIAGTGSQEKYLRGLVSSWALQNVKFLGAVPHHQLPTIYNERDILINASLVDNFPGALVEASAAGLAVVSTGVGGIPFIYRNGSTALLVEPGDWRGLAVAVEKLLQDPSLVFNLTTAGAAAARLYDWQEIRQSVYSSYGCSPDRLGEQAADLEGSIR